MYVSESVIFHKSAFAHMHDYNSCFTLYKCISIAWLGACYFTEYAIVSGILDKMYLFQCILYIGGFWLILFIQKQIWTTTYM